ncbi:MAG: DUF6384 family protein [Roseibium album]|uniref:DUF6384 family protein n=1 Tax=Roseibium album TaxID=311410 RepID=UPI0032ED2DFC
MRLFFCLIWLAFQALCSPVSAQSVFKYENADGRGLIIVAGEFSPDDDLGLLEFLLRNRDVHYVTFDSLGGNVSTAMKIGRVLRQHNVTTVMTRRTECASACVFAFVGGVERLAQPGSIGLHQTSLNGDAHLEPDAAVSAIQSTTAGLLAYLSEMGLKADLLQIMLSIPPHDLRYLTGTEMAEFGVTTPDAIAKLSDLSYLPNREATQPEIKLEELPDLYKEMVNRIVRVAQKSEVADEARRIAETGNALLKKDDAEGALKAASDLREIADRLSEEFEIKIIAREGIPTGVSRIPDWDRKAERFYIVVEAVGADGNPLPREIVSEETGLGTVAVRWGQRVSVQIYEEVRSDKVDDGVVQQDLLGSKRLGDLDIQWREGVEIGTITEW